MPNKYKRLIEFKNKINLLSWDKFNKDVYLDEFNYLINKLDFDINEVIEDYDNIPHRYVTPLLYLLEIKYSCFSDLVLEESLPLINKKIIISSTLEHSLLTVMLDSIQAKGISTDVLIPLFLHFEDLEALDRISSIDKKISMINYLILKSSDYVVSKDFFDLMKQKRIEFQDYKQHSIISSLEFNLNQSLSEIKNLKNKSQILIDIQSKVEFFIKDIETHLQI